MTTTPDRIAIDANGFGWRVWHDEDSWSMVPTNPDNSPIPQPVTWFDKSLPWVDKVLELASLLPDDLGIGTMTRNPDPEDSDDWMICSGIQWGSDGEPHMRSCRVFSLDDKRRIVELVQTIKAAFDA